MSAPADDSRPAESALWPASQRAVGAAETVVALDALAQGLPDPWLPVRWRRLAALSRVERRMWASYRAVLREWLPQASRAVLRNGVIDPIAVESVRPQFASELSSRVTVELAQAFRDGWDSVMVETPMPPSYVQQYLRDATNRMVNVPDSVFRQVNAQVMKATDQGWSIDELAAQIEQVLSDTGTQTWANREVTVARTEAIAAYNAGTLAGFQGFAATAGGEFEKAWLATHDNRVRPTHLAADVGTAETGQRVPLDAPFIVGGYPLMHPGDPSGPPEEVIQCRCSMVLVKPGEHVDLSNRHGKGAK